MNAWPTKRMDELCEITSSKRIFAADYVSEGVPFYRGKEITEKHKGKLDISTELFISDNKFSEIERKFGAPRSGDLLLTSVGTLGSPYVVKPADRFYFKDGNLTWFRHFDGLDSWFLYYWLVSPQGKAELQKCTIGSSQSAFTIVLLKGMEIESPPLPVQRRIAGVLSAYDELIENNQRRIQILETMARALYREWFVEFRFPGHDKIPRVASPPWRHPPRLGGKNACSQIAEVNRVARSALATPQRAALCIEYLFCRLARYECSRRQRLCRCSGASGRVFQHGEDVLGHAFARTSLPCSQLVIREVLSQAQSRPPSCVLASHRLDSPFYTLAAYGGGLSRLPASTGAGPA